MNWIGREQIHKEETESTNNDVHALAMEGAPEGIVVTADVQTAGKGRRGRSWETEKGTALLFSFLLRPDLKPDTAPQITLLMALSVTKAVREMTGLDAFIKWPNDVVVNRKKVCGILTEMHLNKNMLDYIVVGTGVNVNQTVIQEELHDCATSLFLEKSRGFTVRSQAENTIGNRISGELTDTIDREKLLQKILCAFETYYALFLETQDLSALVSQYNEWLVSMNKEVRVLDPKGEFMGISRGINQKGELLTELPSGEIIPIYAGEVSVRGVYGYV